MALTERVNQDPAYLWDLTDIYPDDDALRQALADAQRYPDELTAYKGTISHDATKLLEFMHLDDEVSVTLGKLVNYTERKSDEDTRVSTYQDLTAQVMNLYVAISAASAWAVPEILTLSEADMNSFYTDEPELLSYKRAFDRIFSERTHTLSPAEEALLAKVSDLAQQPGNIYSLLNDADLTFPDAHDSEGGAHPVTHGTYIPLMMSPDRTLRASAFHSLYSTYQQFRNTSAATLAAQMKSQKFYADARHYTSTLERSLTSNEVPIEVYTNLITAVHNHLDALHHYTALRKELLALDELHFWDLYVPVVEDFEMTFTYEQACAIILEALKPLGKEYCAIVAEALNNRWIDVYENPGKRSGAYSAGSYGMHPVMLLNFQGQLDDVFTLIHEMGHSIHTYLSCKNQPIAYSNYVIFVAEVASTCNEALLTHYFLDHATSKTERAYLLNHFLEQFRATLYRQTMFAEFELKINELTAQGVGLTADLLCEIYAKLNKEYFGDEIIVDDEIALEWARIPHFYYEYYVYQYATGFAAAIALSERILHGGQSAVDAYLGFLSGGCSKPPIELLQGAGVDMTTSEPIDEALVMFSSLVDEMSNLIHEMRDARA